MPLPTIEETQAKVDNLVTAIADQYLKRHALFFSDTPQDVEIEFMNPDGTLATAMVPNVAKYRQDVISASGIVEGSASQVGDSGGAPPVELIPDNPSVMEFSEGLTAWDIDIYGYTEDSLESISSQKIKVLLRADDDGAGGLGFNIKADDANPSGGAGFTLVGWMEWGVSGTDSYSGSLVPSGSSADNKLHLFVRNENNLDPTKTSYFKAAIRRTVIHTVE